MGLISTLWLIASVLALSQPSLQSGKSLSTHAACANIYLMYGPIVIGGSIIAIGTFRKAGQLHTAACRHRLVGVAIEMLLATADKYMGSVDCNYIY